MDINSNFVRIARQLFGDDLPHRRIRSGSLFKQTGVNDDRAVWVQGNLYRSIASARTTVSHGNAAADVSALWRFIRRRFERRPKCFLGFDRAIVTAGERFVAFLDKVL